MQQLHRHNSDADISADKKKFRPFGACLKKSLKEKNSYEAPSVSAF
jgi:hypothetical protein